MNVIKGKLFLTTVQKDGELTVLGTNEAMRQLLAKFSPPPERNECGCDSNLRKEANMCFDPDYNEREQEADQSEVATEGTDPVAVDEPVAA